MEAKKKKEWNRGTNFRNLTAKEMKNKNSINHKSFGTKIIQIGFFSPLNDEPIIIINPILSIDNFFYD